MASPRQWIATNTNLTVVQYNTLAQSLSTDTFIGVPPEMLTWQYRCPRLGTEIRRSLGEISETTGLPVTPAVVCLQEVDEDCIGSLQEAAGLTAYKFVYAKKHGDSHKDGVLVLYDPALSLKLHMPLRFVDSQRNTQSQVALLMCFDRFILVSTHLKHGAECADVRLDQAHQIVMALAQLAENHMSPLGQCPVILTGDLNETPDGRLFEALTSQYGLEDVYKITKVPCSFTTWKQRVTGVKKQVEDYILATEITVTSVLAPPNDGEIEPTLLPNANHSSDHLLLAARFAL